MWLASLIKQHLMRCSCLLPRRGAASLPDPNLQEPVLAITPAENGTTVEYFVECHMEVTEQDLEYLEWDASNYSSERLSTGHEGAIRS